MLRDTVHVRDRKNDGKCLGISRHRRPIPNYFSQSSAILKKWRYIPNLTGVRHMPNFIRVRHMPNLTGVRNMPNFTGVRHMPNLPLLPDLKPICKINILCKYTDDLSQLCPKHSPSDLVD